MIISRRLFTELDPAERRVLTAHELSHLTNRHHLFVHLADIAAAANPLLRPVSTAVRLGVERWADEDAAQATGDRRAAGTALARTALTRTSLRRHAVRHAHREVPVLGAVNSDVSHRANALLAPPPRGAAIAGSVITLLVATIAATFACAVQIHADFEHAEMARLLLTR